MTVMNLFLGYIFLGFIITQITEIIKKLIDNYKSRGVFIPLILGLAISFAGKLSLVNMVLSALQLNMGINVVVDRLITGIILSNGANGIYEVIKFLGNIKGENK